MKDERERFLKKIKRTNRFVTIWRLLIIVIILVLWEVLARFHIINTFLASSPSDVFNTFIKLLNDGSLFRHIFVTLLEVLISFVISSILGIIIATLLWNSRTLARIVDPYLTILNSLPKVALGPLIIIIIGASKFSIIVMALLISTFVTIINIYHSFLNTDSNYIILLKSMSASKLDLFLKAVLPSNIINIINTLKVNISMNYIGVIMGELLVSKEGLGYLIMYGSQVFNINLVITSVVVLAILSYLMYIVVELIEKYFKKKLG